MLSSAIFRKLLLPAAIFFIMCESRAANGLVFEYDTFDYAGMNLPYRSVVSGEDNSGAPALVIYLHGGSSKGSDNETQMHEPAIDSIATYLVDNKIHAVFLVPQCPPDKSWGGPMLSAIKGLVDKYTKSLVDDARIYIFGGSMGGTGTWSMLSAYPHVFAAAMPVAGNPSKCDARSVSHTPVYTVMGTVDRIMNIETTSNFIDELTAAGGDCRFEIENGWTHETTCIQSYTAARLDWVFGHILDSAGTGKIDAGNEEIMNVVKYSLDGKLLHENVTTGFYIDKTVYGDRSVSVQKRCR